MKKNIQDTIKQLRADAAVWVNKFSGFGSANRDVSVHTMIYNSTPLSDDVLTALFQDDLGRKLVTKLPETALKNGIMVESQDANLSNKIKMAIDDYDLIRKAEQADIFARNYGGCAIVMDIDDGREPELPLDINNIKSINSLDVVDRRFLHPVDYNYQEPKVYSIQNPFSDSVSVNYHASRMIIFRGPLTDIYEKAKRQMWDISVHDLVAKVLADFHGAYGSTLALLSRSNQAVYKIEGLSQMLSGENAADLKARLEIADIYRSVYNAICIDTKGEEFEYKTANLSGFSDILNNMFIRMAAAADMPVTVLMGQSPAGLSATGESDLRLWNSSVKKHQRDLKPNFEKFIKILLASWGIKEPPVWSVVFPSPYESTPSELLERKSKVIASDVQMVSAGIATAEEIAVFRTLNGYEEDFILDNEGLEARKKAIKQLYSSIENPPTENGEYV